MTLRRAAVAFLVAFLAIPIAHARRPITFLQVNSQQGDFLGSGVNRRIIENIDGGILLMFSDTGYGNGIAVGAEDLETGPWFLTFAAANSGELKPGRYEKTIEVLDGPLPTLRISNGSRGCDYATGYFVVHEIEWAPDHSIVVKFAADFEFHCELFPPAVWGGVRYNSFVPYEDFAPSPFQPITIRLFSEAGDFVGRGEPHTMTNVNGEAFGRETGFRNGIDIFYQTWANDSNFFGRFIPPSQLVPGIYPNAVRGTRAEPGEPGMDVSFDSHGCNVLEGSYVIYEVALDDFGMLDRMALDFEQHCESAAPALFGSIRVNSSVPLMEAPPVGPLVTLPHGSAPPQGRGVVTGTSPSGEALRLSLSGSTQSCTLSSAAFTDPVATGFTPLPSDYTYPYGMIEFQADNCGVGATTNFTLGLPALASADAQWWQFGPTMDDASPHWYSRDSAISGSKLMFAVTDGTLGDNDLAMNGSLAVRGMVMVPASMSGGNPALRCSSSPKHPSRCRPGS